MTPFTDTLIFFFLVSVLTLITLPIWILCRRIKKQVDHVDLLTSIRSENLRKQVEEILKDNK